MEPWRSQLESCIAAATQKIQQNSLWENLSRWPSSFLQHSGLAAIATNAGFPLKRNFFLHQHRHTYHSSAPKDSKHLFDLALTSHDISQKLEGIPVYAVCKNSSEFVLVSDASNQKSLGFFCFRRRDAESLLQQVQAREPLTGKGAKVVAVSLNKLYKLHSEGISFRFLPDPEQVKNALKVAQGYEEKGRSFDGVPVFQSNNLIVSSNNLQFCPVFFCKEDLEQALQTASKLNQKINPSLQVKTGIQAWSRFWFIGASSPTPTESRLQLPLFAKEKTRLLRVTPRLKPFKDGGSLVKFDTFQVGSLEHILKQMEGSTNEQEWGDIVFIPPGMTALGQLENVNRTTTTIG